MTAHFTGALHHFVGLRFQGIGAAVPELPEIQTCVEHAGGVDRQGGAVEADGKRQGVGASVFQTMATGAGQGVVDRQAWFVEQPTTEFDLQGILLGHRGQGFERFVQRCAVGYQTTSE
jgi:hypothetical protein